MPAVVTPTVNSVLPTSQPINIPATMEPSGDSGDLPVSIPPGISVNFWHPWSGEMANLVQYMTTEFNGINEWGIRINPSSFADDQVLSEKLFSAMEEGADLPGLVAAPGYLLVGMEEGGVSLEDLNPFIESAVWGLTEEETAGFFPVFWNYAVEGDRRFGVPAYRTGNFLFYNQSWAQDLGFAQIPASADAFREQACTAALSNQFGKKPENVGTGGWIYSYDPNVFLSWLKSFGGGNISLDPVQVILNGTENVESATFIYEMFLPINNCAWLGRQSSPYQYFSNRQALAYSGRLEDILIQEQVNEINHVNDEWTVFPYPSDFAKPVVLIDGSSFAILSADDEIAIAAWEFVRWMLKPENQKRVVEKTAAFPLSTATLALLEDFREDHPAWGESISFLPFAENISAIPDWPIIKDIFSDISWQLIQFTTTKENIPGFFEEADTLLKELGELHK